MKPPASLRRPSAVAIAFLLGVVGLSLPAKAYDKMVVFGDSLSDNGNISTLIGPGVYTGLDYDPYRLTDGPTTSPASAITGVTVEQLNVGLGLPTLLPSNVGGSNYAWGNALTDFSGLDLATMTTPGTGTQVLQYLSANPHASPDSLFVMWAGANDLYGGTTAADIAAAETAAMGNLRLELTGLLNAGAKHVLWFDLPDLGTTPLGISEGPDLALQLRISSLQFRTDWLATLTDLRTLYPTATITGVDIYAAFAALSANPSAFGFIDTTTSVQGLVGLNPDQYVFWDDTHPTTAADRYAAIYAYQSLLASGDFGGISAVPEPTTSLWVGLFGVSVAVIGVVRRRKRRND